jgi:histidine phosphotransferase ChpT
MLPETAELVALICSRLCHDLAGAIGAVNNGVELLAEEADAAMREEAIGLIAQSAQDAARRLSFFRLALGASGSLQEAMNLLELARVAQVYFAGGKVTLALPQQDTDMPKALGKALLLGLSLAGSALPRGGTLTLTPEGKGWSIRGEGPMLRLNEGVVAGFGQAADWPRDPAPAIARYARILAESVGYGATVTAGDTALQFGFAPA